MTPIQIFEYKQRWMQSNNHPVCIHSDLRREAKEYCRTQLFKHQWVHKEYTNVYEDTFFFERSQDEIDFRNKFKKWLTRP